MKYVIGILLLCYLVIIFGCATAPKATHDMYDFIGCKVVDTNDAPAKWNLVPVIEDASCIQKRR